MKFKQCAFIDESIGRLLLRFISFLPPFPKPITTNVNFKNILLIKFWGMGTILEATPLFRALKKEYPNCPMDLLTFSDNRQIAGSVGLFQNIHTIDLDKGILNLFFQTIKFILKQRGKYSLIIDLEFFASFSALVTKMLNSMYSLGFESFITFRNRCYSRTVVFDHSFHVRVIFFKFLDALYIKRPQDLTLSASYIPDEKKLSVMEKFPDLNCNYLQIAININSSELSINRCWPKENFRKLIGFMQHDFINLQIYLVGGNRDLPIVEHFYDLIPNKKGIHITAGKLDFLEFSYALTNVDFLITNDSGPMHIAESLGIPVVCFFGPETPNLYGSLLKESLNFYKNLFCSPCLNIFNNKRYKCNNNQCLKDISAEEVYKGLKKKLDYAISAKALSL